MKRVLVLLLILASCSKSDVAETLLPPEVLEEVAELTDKELILGEWKEVGGGYHLISEGEDKYEDHNDCDSQRRMRFFENFRFEYDYYLGAANCELYDTFRGDYLYLGEDQRDNFKLDFYESDGTFDGSSEAEIVFDGEDKMTIIYHREQTEGEIWLYTSRVLERIED